MDCNLQPQPCQERQTSLKLLRLHPSFSDLKVSQVVSQFKEYKVSAEVRLELLNIMLRGVRIPDDSKNPDFLRSTRNHKNHFCILAIVS